VLNARTEEVRWAVSDDVRIALLFLDGIKDKRLPWLGQFESFADARGLVDPERRIVRETVVKLRMRGL
jgi:hypothetical protein